MTVTELMHAIPAIELERAVRPGAESFSAGSASFRVNVDSVAGVDELYAEPSQADVLHPISQDGVDDTDLGTPEFAALDLAGNLIGFFTWVGKP